MSRTPLVASQLLYDLVLDKHEIGARLTVIDMLAFSKIIKIGGILANPGLSKALRDMLVGARRVTESDLWAVEHYLRSGLQLLTTKTSPISPKREASNAAIDLLSDFWAEKAVTGDVMSEDERNYAVFLLTHLEIDSNISESTLNLKPILKNKLPGPPQKKFVPGSKKRVCFIVDADIGATVPNREPSSPRKSPRLQKRGWTSYNILSRFFR